MKHNSRTLIALFVTAVALLAGSSNAQAQTCNTGNGNGALKVTSFSSGANVSVDGVDTGNVTPMSISLAVGTTLTPPNQKHPSATFTPATATPALSGDPDPPTVPINLA
jgi:PEGA domain